MAGGGVVAIPTDTVYGLAGRPDLPAAVEEIFSLKARARGKPLPVLGVSVEQLRAVVRFDQTASRLAESFWPGALTIVLPRADGFTHDLGGDSPPTVAVRVPAHHLTLALLERTGPLAVTSANPSGEEDAPTPEDVRLYFGDAFPVLDGGPVQGRPSTAIALDEGELTVLRSGAVSEEALRQSLVS